MHYSSPYGQQRFKSLDTWRSMSKSVTWACMQTNVVRCMLCMLCFGRRRACRAQCAMLGNRNQRMRTVWSFLESALAARDASTMLEKLNRLAHKPIWITQISVIITCHLCDHDCLMRSRLWDLDYADHSDHLVPADNILPLRTWWRTWTQLTSRAALILSRFREDGPLISMGFRQSSISRESTSSIMA